MAFRKFYLFLFLEKKNQKIGKFKSPAMFVLSHKAKVQSHDHPVRHRTKNCRSIPNSYRDSIANAKPMMATAGRQFNN